MQGDTRVGMQGTPRSRGWFGTAGKAIVFAAGLFAGAAGALANSLPVVTLTATPNAIAPGDVTVLKALAADMDGQIAKVAFYEGTTKIGEVALGTPTGGFGSPYLFTLNFRPSVARTYTLTAVAYDNMLAAGMSSPVTLTVGGGGGGANVPPTVSMTATPPTINVGQSTKLQATAADVDGTISKVTFYDGGTLVAETTVAPYTYDYFPAAVGSHTLTAVAVDNGGASTTSGPVALTVNDGGSVVVNRPPVVSLTASPTTVKIGAATTLTAAASDPDGTIAKVDFYNGAVLIGTDTVAPYTYSFTVNAAGAYSLSARAYDDKGAQTTSLPVVVIASTNTPPTVSLSASPTTVGVGATSTLTASAADADGTITKVEFYNGALLVSTDTAAPYSYNFVPAALGTYTLTARAYDNAGAQTTSNSVTVTASTNTPPTVSLTASPNAVAVGSTSTLTANATDADGTIAKVEFYNGATLLSTDMTAPYSFNFVPSAAGTYTLTARAYDNAGAQTTSNTVTVTATGAAVLNLPRITLALSNTLFAPGSTITLTGTAAATSPATVSKVGFYMNGALLSEDTTSPYNATATLPSSGKYTFYAKVTDSLGQVMTTLDQVAVVQTAPSVVTTDADVWRLLNQATFGASQEEAARVIALGVAGWINDQFTKPISGYPDSKYNRIQLNTTADCTTQMPNGQGYPNDSPQALCARDHLTLAMVQRDFFTNAISAPDQLRQRVAWALSQIIVTSANEPDLAYAHVMSRFQNILFQEAFGNYENLLRKVTYNPAMGNYLDMVNNDRPAGTRVPNENYAREIMQLFSIGLYELKADGTPLLDANNQPIATYDQSDIAEFARVFTGYTYSSAANPAGPANGKQGRYYGAPMVPYPTTATAGHDPNAKTLLNVLPDIQQPVVLPAGQTAQQDIDAAVHNVFMHMNTGPFVAKQLIQRLVTGNPSNQYVARISAVFDNNGSGVRGDLAAVVKAILLDPEARGGGSTTDFGQLREPVLMVTGLLRALSGVTDGASLAGATGALGQNPYFAPTVFNYFMPDSKVPGTSILGPEFGIHTTVTAVGRANLVYRLVYQGYAPDGTVPSATGTRVFLAPFEAIADTPMAMVTLVNQVLAGGQFPAALEPTIVNAVNQISLSNPPTAAERTARARMAVYLMASSYDYQVQR